MITETPEYAAHLVRKAAKATETTEARAARRATKRASVRAAIAQERDAESAGAWL